MPAFVLPVLVFAAAPTVNNAVLPLERLRLYETGVGYFERRGKVTGRRGTNLPLPTSHLDDALKTLVVLDREGDAELSGIEFPSAVSGTMARALAGLPSDSEAVGFGSLLTSLKGRDVEAVTKAGKLRGRLIEVLGPFSRRALTDATAKSTVVAGNVKDPAEPEYTVVILGKGGALRRVRTTELTSLRPLDGATGDRIGLAAEALSERSAGAKRRLHVSGTGALALGYIAETPVWRTSYRVILDADGDGATLQGWALLHNDTDEDWNEIQVELVNGRPTSFLYPLASPRYERRELLEPERELASVPQLANRTADGIWGAMIGEEVGESFGVGGLGLVGTGRGGGGTGEGSIGMGSVGTVGSEPTLGDLASFAQASGEDSGTLFVYRLAKPLSLHAHHSALVPIVEHEVEAKMITLFEAHEEEAHAAMRFVNDTGQTLPAGTVAFFADAGFAGEARFARTRPGEPRFMLHGLDLDVDLDRSEKRLEETTTALHYDRRTLTEMMVVKSKVTLEVKNRSRRGRLVYVGLGVDRNTRIEGAPGLDYDRERGTPLVRFEVAGNETAKHAFDVHEVEHRTHARKAISARLLARLADRPEISKKLQAIVAQAAEIQRRIESNRKLNTERATQLARTESDLARLRKNVEALGRADLRTGPAKKLARRLFATERSIDTLRAAIGRADERFEQMNLELDAQLVRLSPR